MALISFAVTTKLICFFVFAHLRNVGFLVTNNASIKGKDSYSLIVLFLLMANNNANLLDNALSPVDLIKKKNDRI